MKNTMLKRAIVLFLTTVFLISQSVIPAAANPKVPGDEIATAPVQTYSDGAARGEAFSEEKPATGTDSENSGVSAEESSSHENESSPVTENGSVADQTDGNSQEITDDTIKTEEIRQEADDTTITEEHSQELTSDSKTSSETESSEDALSSSRATSGPLRIIDLRRDEKTFQINMPQYVMPSDGQLLTAAVWSSKNGQDDLKWYSLVKGANGYSANVDIQNHKTAGVYNVHVYLRRKDNSMQLVCMDTFQVSDISMESVEILQDPSNLSKATLVLHHVSTPSGVTSVSIPVWSRSDQKDIVWYQAVKTGTDTWTADLSYSRHLNSNSKLFHVHIYAGSGNGLFSNIGITQVNMEPGKPLVEARPVSKGIQLSLENCTINNPKDVRFAVWSAANGQDDLKWYTVTTGTGGMYSMEVPFFNETGDYYIHCYARDISGQLVFQNSITYTMEVPSAESVTVAVSDKQDGSFVISIGDITHADMISEISVPVWSAPDQSDLVWYQAEKQENNSWQVKGSIFNHKGNVGRYIVHVYVKDLSGTKRFNCSTDFRMEVPPMEVTAAFSSDYSTVQMTGSYISIPGGVKEVRFAVWTKENGQDDLKWYTAAADNGIYRASARIENHKGNGPLIIHAYAKSGLNQTIFLRAMELQYSTSVNAAFRFDDFSEERFSTDLYLDLSDYQMGIKNVDVAVWSASDQSDIYWYHADQSSDSSWHVAFTPLQHKGHTGTFHFHAYVTFMNGTKLFAGRTDYTVSISNKQYVLENADGTVTAVLYSDQILASPTIAVWSQESGQDDLKWYPLTFNGKCYSATLSIRNHKHNGNYYGHFYGNGIFQGAVTFTFPQTIGTTETLYKTPDAGHNDVKFFNGKLLCSINSGFLALRNFDGSVFRAYPELHGTWLNAIESEGLIVYTNNANQVAIAKVDKNYTIIWNKVIAVLPNLAIDPCIVKNGSEYLITATEILGNVNNSDPGAPNGTYTIRSWKSTDLMNWTDSTEITKEQNNLEEINLVEKNGVLYMAYEKETIDKGNSSILARVSYDNGNTWSEPIELLPADSDHEICKLTVNGDRFVLFYSSDKDALGSSYMGAKAYYAVYDKNLNCISRDVEIKTGAKGGVLIYDVTWIDSTHYILYSENYLTTGTLVVERAR